jgi:nucleoside-diphosphate-sugar epimerase
VKVLLTGARGEIGRDVLPSLRRRHEVVGLDRRDGADVVVDLCDLDAVRRVLDGFDAVVHFAALIGSAESTPSWEYVDANVRATANLLEAAAELGTERFVYISTVWASGHGDTEPVQPIDEAVPCSPVCRYGLTKLMGEDLCRYYARQHGLQATVLRICGYVRPPSGGVAPDGTINWAVANPAELAGRHISMPHFKLYSPDDMAEAVDRALAAPWDGCESYIIGCYAPYTARDRQGLATDPLSVIASYYPEAPHFFAAVGIEPQPFTFWYSFEKAREKLGFRTKHDLAGLIADWRAAQA